MGIIKAGDGGSGDFEAEEQKLRNLVLQMCELYRERRAIVVAAGNYTIVRPNKDDEEFGSASGAGLRILLEKLLGRGSWVRQFSDEQTPHFGSMSEAMWSAALWKGLSDKSRHDYLDLGLKLLENRKEKHGRSRRRGSRQKP